MSEVSSRLLADQYPSFQQFQGTSALGASVRILPALVTAVVINVSTGFFVHRMPVILVVLVAATLSTISPLLMAIVDPEWPYWYMAFIAQVCGTFAPEPLESLPHTSSSHLDPYQRKFAYYPILGPSAYMPRCPIHSRYTDHISRLPCKNTGSRWSSVQHLLATWYINWIDNHISHFRLYYRQIRLHRQEVPSSAAERLSCNLLGIVCMDCYCRPRGRRRSSKAGETWCEA